MKLKNILVSCVLIFGSLSLSGCYTQLSMFYPEPEIEQESEFSDFYQPYSKAPPRLNLTLAAQDGAGQSLGLAYMTMTNRFNFYGGNYMGNRFNNGYYWNEYNLGGYTMYIPYSDPYASGERKQRTFTRTRDGSSPKTNLTVTRTRSTQSSSSNNNTYTNSSNVSSNRSSSEGSSSSSSSSSSSGRRATKRN